jgi:hypothetical protein
MEEVQQRTSRVDVIKLFFCVTDALDIHALSLENLYQGILKGEVSL